MHLRALCKVLPWAKPKTTKTLWLAMKLTVIFLLAACMQVSAKGFGQQITLSERNVSLEKVFNEIRKQAGYEFFYSTGMLQSAKKVSIRVKNAPIEEVLNECFKEQPLNYTIYDKTIVVKAKPPVYAAPTIDSLFYSPPPVDVTGKVTDEQGEVVAGATVTVKGTNRSVSTDENGVFVLKQIDDKATLTISGVNIAPYEIKLEGKTNISITVTKTISELNEAVVVGFGTQKKLNLTGAVSQVSGEVLEDRPVTNVGQALQGLIPNLNLTTTGEPGGPGQNASFNIRGNTNTSGAGPLFIVDGMPIDQINDLNPADIESISVLKDAAASAIYGARGPYGVVIVTTKRGKKGEKAKVTYNNMFGMSTYTRLPKMADSYEFAQAFNIASINSGQGAPFSDEIIAQIKANVEKPGSFPVTAQDPSDPTKYLYASPLNTDNVDWFQAYFRKWAFNQKHDISLSGGSQNTSYYLGVGFLDQEGQLKNADEVFQRYNLTGNIRTEPTKWLRVELKTRYAKRMRDIPYAYAGQMGNWIHMATTRHPNWADINPDGHYSHSSNLEFLANGGRDKSNEDDITLIGSFEIEPIKNWKTNLDYSYNNQFTKRQYHGAYVYAWDLNGGKYNIGPSLNEAGGFMISDLYQSLNFYSSYEKNIGKHYAKIMIGHQRETYNGYSLSGARLDLITDEIPSISTATGQQITGDGYPRWATMGTFGRFNYNYDEKYLLEVNARYDGTSKFPNGNRFGLFPSVSAGYNLARENYWGSLRRAISEFKIRASYGSLGNQNIGNYLYLSTLPILTNINYILNNIRPNALQAPGLVSPDFTWETARTFNIGLDAALLRNRMTVSFDWYVRNTLDMLGPASVLPATLGTGVPLQNNADLKTRGFELTFNWRDRIGNNFSYNASLVLADYKSTIEKYYNPTKLLPASNVQFPGGYYPGMTMGDIWGYETVGLIQSDRDIQTMPDQSFIFGKWSPGDVLYRDLNGDGKVNIGKNTLDDHGDLKVIGNNTPRYSFGINAGFNWKGFDFSMFWQGIAKRDFWLGRSEGNNSGSLFWGFVPGFGNNVYKTTTDFWTPENTDAFWPSPYLSSEMAKNHKVQSRYLSNAAYMRLKNIQLGYDLTHVFKRSGITRLRVFASAENLITITKLNKNYDPEVIMGDWGSGKIYPLLKTVSAGVNLTF
jgi:TonB-linked SusC/RagA family outer membrane protein